MWIRQGDSITNITTSSWLFLGNTEIKLGRDSIAVFKTEQKAKEAFEKIWERLRDYDLTVDLSEVQDEK